MIERTFALTLEVHNDASAIQLDQIATAIGNNLQLVGRNLRADMTLVTGWRTADLDHPMSVWVKAEAPPLGHDLFVQPLEEAGTEPAIDGTLLIEQQADTIHMLSETIHTMLHPTETEQ